jgi:hypothetical protein
MNRSIIALSVVLAATPALAAADYPPGLFENSPVVPSGPPAATAPSGPPDDGAPIGPPDDGAPFGPPDAVGPRDNDCAGVASRIFRSLAEVRRAHARCDPAQNAAPPPDGIQPDE